MKFGKISYVKVIHFSLAGVHYDYQQDGYGNCSCSTYQNPEQFFKELVECPEKRQNIVFTGAWVIDKEKLLEENSWLAFNSPLIDVNINIDSFCSILSKEQKKYNDEELKAFDNVGINVYVNWWRSKGAKIGRMVNETTVEWENK